MTCSVRWIRLPGTERRYRPPRGNLPRHEAKSGLREDDLILRARAPGKTPTRAPCKGPCKGAWLGRRDVLQRHMATRGEAQKLLTAQLEVRNNAEKQLQDAIEVSPGIARNFDETLISQTPEKGLISFSFLIMA